MGAGGNASQAFDDKAEPGFRASNFALQVL